MGTRMGIDEEDEGVASGSTRTAHRGVGSSHSAVGCTCTHYHLEVEVALYHDHEMAL